MVENTVKDTKAIIQRTTVNYEDSAGQRYTQVTEQKLGHVSSETSSGDKRHRQKPRTLVA